MIKKIKEKLKTRSTKTKKHLVGYKIVTDINLYITGGLFPPLITATTLEVEKSMQKWWQISKIHRYILKKKFEFSLSLDNN